MSLFIIYLLFSLSQSSQLTFNSAKSNQDIGALITQCQTKVDALTQQINGLSYSVNQRISSDGVNLYNYIYRDSIIYNDIFAAYNSNIFQKKVHQLLGMKLPITKILGIVKEY